MAGGRSGTTIVEGHEFVFDFNCTLCIRDKESYTEAAHFCSDCNQYYCKKCFFDFGCDHVTLGRAQVDKWGKPSQRIHFDECPDHKTNTLQLYCERDDIVCCAICGQTDHKNCGQLKYIPLIASGKKNKEYLKRLQTDLQQLQTTNDQLLNDWTAKLADLQESHRQLTVDIKQLKASYIAELDKLEQESLNNVNRFKKEFDNKCKSELKKVADIKLQLSDIKAKLNKQNIDDSLMFARIKQGKEFVQKTRKIISEIDCSKAPHQTTFVADARLEQCIHSLQRLGTLTTDKPIGTEKVVGPIKGQGQGHGLGLSSIQTNRPYTVKQRTRVNVKVKGDKSTCIIYGMCQLPDGSILLADYSNKKLKRLDDRDRVIGSCPLSASPYDVCNTELGEVAVTLYVKTIKFVSVGDTMTATRSFSTSHDCWSLTYHNKRLYVISLCGSAVHVYSLSGSPLHTISTDQHGTPMFSDTRNITVSPVVGRIYVADLVKGLVTLDLEGNLLYTYKPPEFENGDSICVDGEGNVFVNEIYTTNVVQVGREGTGTVARIVVGSDKINVFKLCFDNVGTRLLVSAGYRHDTVTVLHLTQ